MRPGFGRKRLDEGGMSQKMNIAQNNDLLRGYLQKYSVPKTLKMLGKIPACLITIEFNYL